LFDIPEYRTSKVNVVLDQPHTTIAWPATLVVVANDVVVRRVGICAEVTLDKVSSFLSSEAEENMNAIDVSRVQANGMASLGRNVSVLEEVVGHLGRTSHLTRALQAKNEDIQDQTVVLKNESGELQTSDEAIPIRMGHVLVRQD
jgi:hypothetical protein